MVNETLLKPFKNKTWKHTWSILSNLNIISVKETLLLSFSNSHFSFHLKWFSLCFEVMSKVWVVDISAQSAWLDVTGGLKWHCWIWVKWSFKMFFFQESVWLWSDGSKFDFKGWAKGEPNNAGGENCMEMNFMGTNWLLSFPAMWKSILKPFLILWCSLILLIVLCLIYGECYIKRVLHTSLRNDK